MKFLHLVWIALFCCIRLTVFSQVFMEVPLVDNASMNESLFDGSGITFFDWDDDGWDDITVINPDSFPRFFKNNSGVFEEVYFTDLQFSAAYRSACWVDIENDGDYDLFFNTYYDGSFLYRNDGDMTFTDISVPSGIVSLPMDGYGQC